MKDYSETESITRTVSDIKDGELPNSNHHDSSDGRKEITAQRWAH
jgi:hypothetical protein